ncbi:hypothetical protein CYY_009003 [Polysphondylium violaceum]|uniref:Uncharacterized protein n=1 Tax=Polysphondylium violaceum TaxID=133409 RepID=A0A8J4PNI7_9MYCE|nr:hypothetical protein CYY_009003 [Polysphondylium violaceum]
MIKMENCKTTYEGDKVKIELPDQTETNRKLIADLIDLNKIINEERDNDILVAIHQLTLFQTFRIEEAIIVLEQNDLWKTKVLSHLIDIPKKLTSLLLEIDFITRLFIDVVKLLNRDIDDFHSVVSFGKKYQELLEIVTTKILLLNRNLETIQFNIIEALDRLERASSKHKVLAGLAIASSVGCGLVGALLIGAGVVLSPLTSGTGIGPVGLITSGTLAGFSVIHNSIYASMNIKSSKKLDETIKTMSISEESLGKYKTILQSFFEIKNPGKKMARLYRLKVRDNNDCPICFSQLKDPVYLMTGTKAVFYCRNCISGWIQIRGNDPFSRRPIGLNRIRECEPEHLEIIRDCQERTKSIKQSYLLKFNEVGDDEIGSDESDDEDLLNQIQKMPKNKNVWRGKFKKNINV